MNYELFKCEYVNIHLHSKRLCSSVYTLYIQCDEVISLILMSLLFVVALSGVKHHMGMGVGKEGLWRDDIGI